MDKGDLERDLKIERRISAMAKLGGMGRPGTLKLFSAKWFEAFREFSSLYPEADMPLSIHDWNSLRRFQVFVDPGWRWKSAKKMYCLDTEPPWTRGLKKL
jgi:hypothetical protein